MLIENVDAIGLQTLQAGIGHRLDMLGPAVGAATAIARLKVDVEAELCGNQHMVPNGLDRLADELLIDERTVGFSRVEQGHTAIMGGADEFDHLLVVSWRAVSRTHAHAAKAERGYFQCSKFAGLHCSLQPIERAVQHRDRSFQNGCG